MLEVKPTTGNRTIASDATRGFGPWGTYVKGPTAVVVVPNVPEPSTVVLAALVGLKLLIGRRKHGR
ncbi:MAG TPA: PEP-CTERM sorting domain-containing protein [Pirellulales bacterium]